MARALERAESPPRTTGTYTQRTKRRAPNDDDFGAVGSQEVPEDPVFTINTKRQKVSALDF
jgi:hypothetical protein